MKKKNVGLFLSLVLLGCGVSLPALGGDVSGLGSPWAGQVYENRFQDLSPVQKTIVGLQKREIAAWNFVKETGVSPDVAFGIIGIPARMRPGRSINDLYKMVVETCNGDWTRCVPQDILGIIELMNAPVDVDTPQDDVPPVLDSSPASSDVARRRGAQPQRQPTQRVGQRGVDSVAKAQGVDAVAQTDGVVLPTVADAAAGPDAVLPLQAAEVQAVPDVRGAGVQVDLSVQEEMLRSAFGGWSRVVNQSKAARIEQELEEARIKAEAREAALMARSQERAADLIAELRKAEAANEKLKEKYKDLHFKVTLAGSLDNCRLREKIEELTAKIEEVEAESKSKSDECHALNKKMEHLRCYYSNVAEQSHTAHKLSDKLRVQLAEAQRTKAEAEALEEDLRAQLSQLQEKLDAQQLITKTLKEQVAEFEARENSMKEVSLSRVIAEGGNQSSNNNIFGLGSHPTPPRNCPTRLGSMYPSNAVETKNQGTQTDCEDSTAQDSSLLDLSPSLFSGGSLLSPFTEEEVAEGRSQSSNNYNIFGLGSHPTTPRTSDATGSNYCPTRLDSMYSNPEPQTDCEGGLSPHRSSSLLSYEGSAPSGPSMQLLMTPSPKKRVSSDFPALRETGASLKKGNVSSGESDGADGGTGGSPNRKDSTRLSGASSSYSGLQGAGRRSVNSYHSAQSASSEVDGDAALEDISQALQQVRSWRESAGERPEVVLESLRKIKANFINPSSSHRWISYLAGKWEALTTQGAESGSENEIRLFWEDLGRNISQIERSIAEQRNRRSSVASSSGSDLQYAGRRDSVGESGRTDSFASAQYSVVAEYVRVIERQLSVGGMSVPQGSKTPEPLY